MRLLELSVLNLQNLDLQHKSGLLSTANSFTIVFKYACISNDIYIVIIKYTLCINIHIINIIDMSPGNIIQ